MKILAVDIGTGTQDILLFDSRLDVENAFKLVLPSPTMMVHRKIQQATHQQAAVVLTGTVMGGGPAAWAAEAHARAGLPIYATPLAAATINDDLSKVEALGIQIIDDEDAAQFPPEVCQICLRDFNFQIILEVFQKFQVPLDDLAAVAVAAFDHGAAPPEISDRKFRFDFIRNQILEYNSLSGFAWQSRDIPKTLTRLRAIGESAKDLHVPLIVMDTAPAAVLGATFDPAAKNHDRIMIANVGNFHTLAFRLGPDGIEGLFEHHTGLLDQVSLEHYLLSLANGTLSNDNIFEDHGHGALILSDQPLQMDYPDYNLIVTGPRRSMLAGSSLGVHQAVPFGDMMLAGCFGLIAATADCVPDYSEIIHYSLGKINGLGTPPWEIH